MSPSKIIQNCEKVSAELDENPALKLSFSVENEVLSDRVTGDAVNLSAEDTLKINILSSKVNISSLSIDKVNLSAEESLKMNITSSKVKHLSLSIDKVNKRKLKRTLKPSKSLSKGETPEKVK